MEHEELLADFESARRAFPYWANRLGLTGDDLRKMRDLALEDGELLLPMAKHAVARGSAGRLRREDQDPELALCTHLDLMGDRYFAPGKGIAVCGKPFAAAVVRYLQYQEWLGAMEESQILMRAQFLARGSGGSTRTITWKLWPNNVAEGVDDLPNDPYMYGAQDFSHLQFNWKDDRSHGAVGFRESAYDAEAVVRRRLLGKSDDHPFALSSRAQEVQLRGAFSVHNYQVQFRVHGRDDAREVARAVLEVCLERFGETTDGSDGLAALRQQVAEIEIGLNDIPTLPWRERADA